MSEAILEVQGLKKNFLSPSGETLEILKGIDFSARRGETISIVGASGAGKTTFLHILGLLDHASDGNIIYLQKNVNKLSQDDKSRFRNGNIGFIFQMHYLLPEFTALENAVMPLLIRGENMAVAEKKAVDLFEKVGLADRMDHKPGTLSGGEQQRVALVRAFMGDPLIILADEPTGNLDKKNAGIVAELFLKLNKEKGTALVMATHNEELASMMMTKYRIDDGCLERL